MAKETAELRATVVERSKNRCECGCGRWVTAESGQLDHFFGRAKAKQAVRNCWLLTLECHTRKTENKPSSIWWLERFAAFAQQHGYKEEQERALARLEFQTTKFRVTNVRSAE